MGITQSKHDDCIFGRGRVIIVIYTDDTIITGPSEVEVDEAIRDIGSMFEITHKAQVDDFLGVQIERNIDDNTVTFKQPQLINSILLDLGLSADHSSQRNIPALVSQVLHHHHDSPDHAASWKYRSSQYLVICYV